MVLMKMGSFFKKAIFDEHVQEGLLGWAQKVKQKKALRAAKGQDGSNQAGKSDGSSTSIQLQKIGQRDSLMEEGDAKPLNQ